MKLKGSIGLAAIIIGELAYKRYARSRVRIWFGIPGMGS